ncbi:MAG: hypothetical protein PHH70_02755 [Candidatus Gracilibacteria bacterium]|nr:hypothetical protein [Candidatus Gracilibacteria bacterium]
MEVVVQKKQEIEQQKAHLTTLIEELKESQKDYDFSDYEERLLLSDTEIENILENDIFREDEELTELGENFYRYLDILTEGKSEELKGKMKRKLVRELGLEDRVYENNVKIKAIEKCLVKMEFKNTEQFIRDIQLPHFKGIRDVNIGGEYLFHKLSIDEITNLILAMKKVGIKDLDLGFNNDFKLLNNEYLFKLIQIIGNSGIRILALGGNNLSEVFDNTSLIQFVQVAGKYGIRSLDLTGNELSQILDVGDVQKLVQTAGKSGIRSLNLSRNHFYLLPGYDMNDSQGFVELIKIAGTSLLHNLGFENHNLQFAHNTTKHAITALSKKYNMNITY